MPLPEAAMTAVRLRRPRALLALDGPARRRWPPRSSARASDSPTRATAPCCVELTTGTLRWRNELDALRSRGRSAAACRLDPAVARRCCGWAPISCAISTAFPRTPSSTNPSRPCGHSAAHGGRLRQRRPAAPIRRRQRRLRCRSARRRRAAVAAAASPTCRLRSRIPRWLVARWLARYGFDADGALVPVQ